MRIMLTLCAAVGLFLMSNFAHADDHTNPAYSVTNAYAYATAPSQKNGALFAVIENKTDRDVAVTAAELDTDGIADRLELHTHLMDDGVMMMREVESYDLPAHDKITLEPKGHHIMIMGLAEPLKAGNTLPVTLTIDGNPVSFEAQIKNPGDVQMDKDNQSGHHDHDHGDMH